MPLGKLFWRNGYIMAAATFFEIKITRKGAHASQPHFGIDPIVTASALVNGLQTIVSRNVDPKHSSVVTIGSFHSGVAANVIPRDAVLSGTARWLDPSVGEIIEHSIRRMAQATAANYGATADVEMHLVAPATVNDEDAMQLGRNAATAVLGTAGVQEMDDPIMGAEDFAYMLGVKQGAYIMLGAQREGANPMLHHPAYDFNDTILSTGAAYWATLVEQQLAV